MMKDFSSDVRIHSRKHLELKTSFPVPNGKTLHYTLNCYFFFPAQLNLSKTHYGTHEFLKDVQTYTRFSSPGLSIASLMEPGFELSPLNRIKDSLSTTHLQQDIPEKRVIYELQVLANTLRSEVKNFIALIEEELRKPARGKNCSRKISSFIDDVIRLLQEFRNLHPLFLDSRVSPMMRKSLDWTDETMTFIIENNMIPLYILIRDAGLPQPLLDKIRQLVEEEDAYRHEREFPSAFAPDSEEIGETIAYRKSMLKKWSQSAMYMTSEASKAPKRIGHILAGAAAALAMSFAVFAAIYAERFFLKNSTPWALLIVLSYVFKDRIKEILREIFGKALPKLMADEITLLKDPATQNNVGNSRGYVRFMKMNEAPQEILKIRNPVSNPFRSFLPQQDVIQYSRVLTIDAKRLHENHLRLEAINEITRLRVDTWLREMDDPEEMLLHLEEGEPVRIKGKRVYHAHLIVALQETKKGQPEYFHYKVIMNRSGLIRLKQMK